MGVQLPLPVPRYFYPKALIIKEITATAITHEEPFQRVSPIFQVQKQVQRTSSLFSIA